jgi:TatD DNase family protein
MLIDSHCHLDRLHLFGGSNDVDAVLNEARSRGVGGFLAIGVDLTSSQNLIELAAQHPDIRVAVGAHPLQEEEIAVPSVEELVALAANPGVVAIGETGLDYYYSEESKAWQQASFINHLRAGKESQKPVVVHTRNAQQDTLDLIAEHASPESGGVLHCFTESWEMARAALELNFYVSFSGIITFRNAGGLREVVRQVPLDRILVETDSPWLAPVPYRGKSNVPAYVVEVAEKVAEIKGISRDEVSAATTENFQRLFRC